MCVCVYIIFQGCSLTPIRAWAAPRRELTTFLLSESKSYPAKQLLKKKQKTPKTKTKEKRLQRWAVETICPDAGVWGKKKRMAMAGGCRSAVGGRAAAALCHRRWENQMWGEMCGMGRRQRGTPRHGWERCWQTRRLCVIRDAWGEWRVGKGGGAANLPSNRGLLPAPGPFPSKTQQGGVRWVCTSSLKSILARKTISTRFILPGSSERLRAAALRGSPSLLVSGKRFFPRLRRRQPKNSRRRKRLQTALSPR